MLLPCLAMGSSSKFESIFCEYHLFLFHLLRFSNREDSNLRQKLSFLLLPLLRFLFFFFFAIYKRFEPVSNPLPAYARSHRYTRVSSSSIGVGNQIAFYEIRHDRYTNKLSICLCWKLESRIERKAILVRSEKSSSNYGIIYASRWCTSSRLKWPINLSKLEKDLCNTRTRLRFI